jgi:general secretion pathway protein C
MIAPRTLLTVGQLVLLALAALFSATTVNGFVAAALRPRPTLDLAGSNEAEPHPAKKPLIAYAAITERDIFNPPKPVEPEAAPQASPLNARLLGTAPGNGIDSFAILEDGGNKVQQLYRVGDKFQNRTLASVEWDRVILKNGSRDEVLKIVEPTGKVSPVSAVAPTGGSGIQARGDNEYLIDRSEVDKAMENLNQLFTQVRAVPHFQDGKAAGFRLFAIRQDSIFEKIGLKNGDVVSKINGNELTDPARAMGLIQELRNEGRVSVELMRNRQPTTISYEIR